MLLIALDYCCPRGSWCIHFSQLITSVIKCVSACQIVAGSDVLNYYRIQLSFGLRHGALFLNPALRAEMKLSLPVSSGLPECGKLWWNTKHPFCEQWISQQ